ncbi:MAG: helix-turn-helix domain-containing protein, partial [Bacteroidetes bacterium]|nr:helix-turn-helix domain-containing protein [Bacteroidota bacterium]
MKKTIMKNSRQDFHSLIKEHAGYSQIPKFIHFIGLSKHALLVLFYLISCVNLKKGRFCFPSIKDISKKCSIPSETTVREAIKELHRKRLITKETRGRKNFYEICKHIYTSINLANGKDCDFSELEDISSYSDGIENEETEKPAIETPSDALSPVYDESGTYSDAKYHHHVLPNKNKRTRLKNNINEQEEENTENTNFKRVSIDRNESTKGKTTSHAEVNGYYQSLTESEQQLFDSAARALVRPGEANPGGKIQMLRTARLRFYELLKQEPKRQDGFE